jgi:RNA polymerase sigma-70 factor (ECF subfamily)
MPDAREDDRLVADCLALVPGAWDRFLTRFAGLFRHVARRVSPAAGRQRPEDLDDAVAEIVFEVLRNDAAVLRSYAGRSGLATYLAVVGRRVVLRRLCRRDGVVRPGGYGPVDAHDDMAVILTRDQIEGLLAHLDDADSRLVRLHYLESRSYGEISRITGLPLGSIGPALSRARRLMRDAAVGAALQPAPFSGGRPSGQHEADGSASRQQAG